MEKKALKLSLIHIFHQCIKEILKEQESVEIRSYDCAEDFLEEVQKKTRFDILFSDIQMLSLIHI